MRLILFFAIATLLASCGTSKSLAEKCAEAFPAEVIRDTITEVHWEVKNFPVEVERIDTMFLDTVPCPPSADTVYVERVKKVTIPARTIKTKAPVEVRTITVEKIDSALIQAYEDLETKYREAIKQLEACEARYKETKRRGSGWLAWAILGALLLLAIVLAVKKK